MAMELYTLTPGFVRDIVIDEFESVIWTERYTQAGDVTLVLPFTHDRIRQLKPGSFLALKGTKEVMLLETQVLEDNMMTVTGNTLDKFFEQRVTREDGGAGIMYGPNHTYTYLLRKGPPGQILASMVTYSAIYLDPNSIRSQYNTDYLSEYGPRTNIRNLTLGPIANGSGIVMIGTPLLAGPPYDSPNPLDVGFPANMPLYQELLKIAEAHQLGMSLYLDSADANGFSLKFTVTDGADRTSSQTVNQLLRFSGELDSLTNIKELRSITDYKNMVHLYSPKDPAGRWQTYFPIVVVAPGEDIPALDGGFALRMAVLVVNEITPNMIEADQANRETINGSLYVGLNIGRLMVKVGKDYLMAHKRTRVIDGETVPGVNYVYKKDYHLGDIAEVEGVTGAIQKVRITEYIRSQDQTGQREYPTLAKLEAPLESNYDTLMGT